MASQVELDPVEAGLLRGCLWRGTASVPYPRADPADVARLPGDTWAAASIPAGVHLEWVGKVECIEIDYTTATGDLGYRGEGAGTSFSLWLDEERLSDVAAVVGQGVARFAVAELVEKTAERLTEETARAEKRDRLTGKTPGWTGENSGESTGGKRRAERGADALWRGRFRCYLPEGMRPHVHSLRVSGAMPSPPPESPRVVVYGDSIAEGWSASGPPLAWPAQVERALGIEVANLGYAGAARGEIASAEQIASLPKELVAGLVLAYGTNCWTRVPYSKAMLGASFEGFIDVVRQSHADVPIVVASPILRPDAEKVPNKLGATLEDLREVMEQVVEERMRTDGLLRLVRGAWVVDPEDLVDGVHPGDEGHKKIATAIGQELGRALEAKGAL